MVDTRNKFSPLRKMPIPVEKIGIGDRKYLVYLPNKKMIIYCY